MSDEEKMIGRIKAVLYASEIVVNEAKPKGVRDAVIMAKETAYDHIVGIINDPSYCPWQE